MSTRSISARGVHSRSLSTVGSRPAGAGRPPRVREQARDAVTVMAFSATTSAALAAGLVLLSHLGRQG
jgi:hypothetical protein